MNSSSQNSFGFCSEGKASNCNIFFGINYPSNNNPFSTGFGMCQPQTAAYNNLCYNSFSNIKEKDNLERKGDNMSFVGIGLCNDGFIAFGDSRSTLTDPLGNQYVDDQRDNVKKVFKGKDFLLVSYGVNQFFDLYGVKVNLEDIIEGLVSKGITYFRVIEEILTMVSSNQGNQGISINFIVGSIDDHGPFVQGVYLENEVMILRRKSREHEIYTGGVTWYTNRINSIIFDGRKGVEQNLQNVVESVQNMINEVDETAVYNPVGAPIVTEKLLFEECTFS